METVSYDAFLIYFNWHFCKRGLLKCNLVHFTLKSNIHMSLDYLNIFNFTKKIRVHLISHWNHTSSCIQKKKG